MASNDRSGRYVRLGDVRSFDPKPLPPDPPIELSTELTNALSWADRSLARLDGATSTLPNPDMFVYAFMRQEATLSSQIEGTQASLEDLFAYESAGAVVSAIGDVTEIANYLDAINWGLNSLSELPVSLRLVRGMHERLLKSGRGSARNPGNFREGQNFIGPPGSRLEDATFVPPAVPLMIPALKNWEEFLHSRELPALIRCALIHAQFETIHPFWDGNGRLGRMIITLKLCEEEILEKPILYLSLFFKKTRDEYYYRLQSVRDRGDWESWIIYFLNGVRITCRSALQAARKIILLREEVLARAQSVSRSSNPARLAEALFWSPYLTVNQARTIVDTSYQGAANIIQTLVDSRILTPVGDARRGRIFAFRPYLDILHETADDLPEAAESNNFPAASRMRDATRP